MTAHARRSARARRTAPGVIRRAVAPVVLAWLALGSATAWSGDGPDLPPPDLPDVVVTVGEPARAAAADPEPAIAVPVPPDVAAIVGVDMERLALSAAVEARLASPELHWPKRLAKREREAVTAFYAARGNAPIWIDGRHFNMRAASALAQLARAAEDGLNPADYVAPRIDVLPASSPLTVLAEAEIRLSALVVLYARDARGGRLEPSRLSRLWTPALQIPAAEEVLASVSGGEGRAAGETLAGYQPVHAGYRALRTALAELRGRHPGALVVRVPRGPALRVGMRDPRVPLVRARFGLGPDDRNTVYDERVASAVAEFQKLNGLPASGILTDRTVSLLGSGIAPARQEARIIANMERWRWLPPTLGERHILVNVPEFKLRLVEKDKVVHEARIIVGKTETQTPLFSDEMEYAVVNPSWYIPPSILRKEILPGLAENPNYAAERGYEVIRRGDSISVRQPPGERNALGFIKFMFPNQHAVYLHDTPNRRLFGAARRAFSHGCVRVDQPFRLADFVFQGDWNEQRLKALIGKGERTLKLRQPLPVHLAYFTVSAEEGRLVTRDDLYGVDQKLIAALGLD